MNNIRRAVKFDSATADLTSAPLSKTTDFNCDWELGAVRLHASAGITETVKVFVDSKEGANYDVELVSNALSAEDDYVFRPTGQCILAKGDEIKVTCTNGNTTGSVYATIRGLEL